MQAVTTRMPGTSGDPTGSHMKTVSSGILNRFNVIDEIERCPLERADAGVETEMLVRSDRLRVLLVTMESEAQLAAHAAPGPSTIHVLKGRFLVNSGREEHALGAGNVIALDTRVRHSVRALDAGAFLLTISWPPRMAGDPIF